MNISFQKKTFLFEDSTLMVAKHIVLFLVNVISNTKAFFIHLT